MKKALNTEAVHVHLPPQLAAQLRSEADRLEVTLAEVIRTALRTHLPVARTLDEDRHTGARR